MNTIKSVISLSLISALLASSSFANGLAVQEVVAAAAKVFGTGTAAATSVGNALRSLNAGSSTALETANSILIDKNFEGLVRSAKAGAFNKVGGGKDSVTTAVITGQISYNLGLYLELAREKALPKLSADRYVQKLEEYLRTGTLSSLNKTYETALSRILNAENRKKANFSPENELKNAFAANWIRSNSDIKELYKTSLVTKDSKALLAKIDSLWLQFITECL